MSIYGIACLNRTVRVVNNTIVRPKRPLMPSAANAESEPALTNAARCTNVRYHEQSYKPSTTT